MKTYGFYLNGETLLKTVKCSNVQAAKKKLDFSYPINFNIQIKQHEENWNSTHLIISSLDNFHGLLLVIPKHIYLLAIIAHAKQ